MAITLQLVTTQWSINLTLIRMSFNKKYYKKKQSFLFLPKNVIN